MLKGNARLVPSTSFPDIKCGGKAKGLALAVKHRDSVIASLPKDVQKTLNTGAPRHKKDAGVSLCRVKRYKSRYYDYYYIAFCWNKYTKTKLRKSISITSTRPQPMAHQMAVAKRKEFMLEVERDGRRLGFK